MPNVWSEWEICGFDSFGLAARLGNGFPMGLGIEGMARKREKILRGGLKGRPYVVVRPQTQNHLTVHIPTPQPPTQPIVRRPEHGREHMRRRKDLKSRHLQSISQSITFFKKTNKNHAQRWRQRTRTQSRNCPAAIGRGGRMRFGARCRVRCGPPGLAGGAPGAGFEVLPFLELEKKVG